LSCIFLTGYLPKDSWWRFGIWLLVGIVVYISYGYRHSRMRGPGGPGPSTPGGPDFNPESAIPRADR